MAKAIKAWEGGIHARVQFAATADGKLFRRVQNKTSRGYQWSAWNLVGSVDVKDLPNSMSAGFSTCYSAGQYSGWQKWRLPG